MLLDELFERLARYVARHTADITAEIDAERAQISMVEQNVDAVVARRRPSLRPRRGPGRRAGLHGALRVDADLRRAYLGV